MTRDYSHLFPTAKTPTPPSPLRCLGWQHFFAQQLSADELIETPPARVTAVHRSRFHVLGDGIDVQVPPLPDTTVGDWVLYDPATGTATRRLERKSLIKRRAPGTDRAVQLIAANIDTAFIVTSCNQDFNVARLERYVALVLEAELSPVILLTKVDLCDDAQTYLDEARKVSSRADVVALDARHGDVASQLAPWTGAGQTIAFLGSSGVGKSTLTNALTGGDTIATQEIREADDKGRHTTTHRALHPVAGGCMVMDTPGMRQLQLTDIAAGVEAVFADLHDLSAQCRFRDCMHDSEPGCAVQAAVADGTIDADRIRRWRKLVSEEERNTANLAERRSKDKQLGKFINSVQRKNPKE
tara:strand:+ start:6527 stop:7594 length:1068 start_codon:yes stop_codon:yes gene_type:complete